MKSKYDDEQEKAENEAEKDIKVRKEDNEVVIKDLVKDNEKADSEKRAKRQSLDLHERQLEE